MAGTKSSTKSVRRRKRTDAHDALFYGMFSIPKHAASALRDVLPKSVVERIRWDKLRKRSDTFVDPKLTKRYSDVLFEVEIDHETALIYVLYEHKSKSEMWTLLQLLEYMVRIWQEHVRSLGGKRSKLLPIILPVVLHHGKTGWTAPRRFTEYFGKVQRALRPYLVDFGIFLDDVSIVAPDKLVTRPLTPEVKLILLALALGRTPDRFFAELEKHPHLVQEVHQGVEETVVFSMLIVYLEAAGQIPQEVTVKALRSTLKMNIAERILNAERYLKERAEDRVRREGKREGKLEASQNLVSKLLVQRFGSLPAEAMHRMQTASQTELEEMALRVLSATTLDDVLVKT